jgi:hypothetical protein
LPCHRAEIEKSKILIEKNSGSLNSAPLEGGAI